MKGFLPLLGMVVSSLAAQALRKAKIQGALQLVRTTMGGDKKTGKESKAQGSGIQFEEPSPWPVEVSGVELLEELEQIITTYSVLPPGGAVALALFVVHTYTLDTAEVSPIVTLLSPELRCGKTTTLEVSQCLVYRPLPTSNITSPALFRTVELYRPTLLVDEADTFLRNSEEMRGVINSGHRKASAQIIRTSGDDYEPRSFSTWCGKLISAIGNLPGTIQDRSIVIGIKRKAKGEIVSRLRFDRLLASTAELREKLVRWSKDNSPYLVDADPEMPEDLNDRATDNWRHLIAIADLAGGEWPARAREAAKLLSGAADSDADDSVRVQLLIDLQGLFHPETDRLSSQHIVEKLGEMEERPWPEWGKQQKQITAPQLARLLKPFGIKPKQAKINGKNIRSYFLEDMEDAFKRYIPDTPPSKEEDQKDASNRNIPDTPPPEPLPPLPPAPALGLSTDSKVLPGNEGSTLENGANPHQHCIVAGVALRKGGSGVKSEKGAEDEYNIL